MRNPGADEARTVGGRGPGELVDGNRPCDRDSQQAVGTNFVSYQGAQAGDLHPEQRGYVT